MRLSRLSRLSRLYFGAARHNIWARALIIDVTRQYIDVTRQYIYVTRQYIDSTRALPVAPRQLCSSSVEMAELLGIPSNSCSCSSSL